jgi:hypothetical protein
LVVDAQAPTASADPVREAGVTSSLSRS